jgi:hypothetical protein
MTLAGLCGQHTGLRKSAQLARFTWPTEWR